MKAGNILVGGDGVVQIAGENVSRVYIVIYLCTLACRLSVCMCKTLTLKIQVYFCRGFSYSKNFVMAIAYRRFTHLMLVAVII